MSAYIAEAKRRGLKLALASSSTHAWVDSHLDRIGHLEDFEVVKSRDDVHHAKPAPDLYLAALAELGLDVSEVIAFEDSINGSLAAKRAGIFSVAVPTPLCARTISSTSICGLIHSKTCRWHSCWIK